MDLSQNPATRLPVLLSGGVAALAAGFLRLLTGAVPRWIAAIPAQGPIVFYVNHTSHLDSVVLWALLPPERRARTRPVAAKDYWLKSSVRRFLACRVFNVVLVTRGKDRFDPEDAASPHAVHQSLTDMHEALAAGSSLILFPEGTRGDGTSIARFKSGLYHLARHNPGVPLVPVYMDNLNRILPKGEHLLVPLICNAHFGAPVLLRENETKAAFLERARQALEDLKCP